MNRILFLLSLLLASAPSFAADKGTGNPDSNGDFFLYTSPGGTATKQFLLNHTTGAVQADVFTNFAGTGAPTFSQGLSSSSPVLWSNGTAGAPSAAFTNSPTTGLYRAGTDILGITTAGTSAGQIDATRLWTVGPTQTTTAAQPVHILNGSLFAGATGTGDGNKSLILGSNSCGSGLCSRPVTSDSGAAVSFLQRTQNTDEVVRFFASLITDNATTSTQIASSTAQGAWLFGASSATGITSPSHGFYGSIYAANTGLADADKRFLISSNGYNSAFTGLPARNSNGGTLGGAIFQIADRTADSGIAFGWYTNLAADTNTTNAALIGNVSQTGLWTMGNGGVGSPTTAQLTLDTGSAASTGSANYLRIGPNAASAPTNLSARFSAGGYVLAVNGEGKSFGSDSYGQINTGQSSSAISSSPTRPIQVVKAAAGTSTAAYATFWTVLMEMESGGIMNVPLQPSAGASRSTSDQTCVSGTADSSCVLIAQSESIDQGSNYNNATGVFTVPGGGTYLVTATVNYTYTTNPSTSPAITLRPTKNGSTISGFVLACGDIAGVGATSRLPCSGSWIIQAGNADTLAITVSSNVGNGGSSRVLTIQNGLATVGFAKLN